MDDVHRAVDGFRQSTRCDTKGRETDRFVFEEKRKSNTIELTDDHQSKIESLLNGLSIDLVRQIRKTHVTIEFFGLGLWRWSWMKNSGFLVLVASVRLPFIAVLRCIVLIQDHRGRR